MKICKSFFLTGLALVLMAVSAGDTEASDNLPVKIAIVPFGISSEKDLSFLQNGIQNMLTTRLTRDDKIKLISRTDVEEAMADLSGPMTRQNAGALGKKLFADYVVFGSLTVFGESVSTDAELIDVANGEPVVTFNQSGKSRGDVIPHVNLFSQQVYETLFGPGPAPVEQPVAAGKAKPAGPAIGAPEPDFLKSRKFDLDIMSFAMGDVDGDGRKEIVFVGTSDILVYRYLSGRFIKVAEIKEKSHNNFIRVDVGDINRNGKAEIFITNLSRTGTILNSLVMEWDGAAYQKTVTKQNMFFRVIRTPDRGLLLLGQNYNKEKVFEKGVNELIWNGNIYDTGNPYNIPLDKNIYEFTYGDPLQKGRQTMTYFSAVDDRIRVLDENGDQAWESDGKYGGSYTFVEYHDVTQRDDTNRYFIPQRIFVTDFDKDGKDDLIVVKNKDTSSRIFGKLRMFKLGYIECLTWKGLGFQKVWKTQQISGYISDYSVGDIDGDGRNELLCAVVEKKDAVVAKPKSYLVVWNRITANTVGNTEEAFGAGE